MAAFIRREFALFVNYYRRLVNLWIILILVMKIFLYIILEARFNLDSSMSANKRRILYSSQYSQQTRDRDSLLSVYYACAKYFSVYTF